MRCIADANVLLPILSSDHPHHAIALGWWEERDPGEIGLCLPVRMALLRLLSNRHVMGSSVQRPEAAWAAVEAIATDPRMAAIHDVPPGHSEYWRRNVGGREPTPDLWTDAWLAALAQSLACELVTFDRDFRSFKGLKLQLLTV